MSAHQKLGYTHLSVPLLQNLQDQPPNPMHSLYRMPFIQNAIESWYEMVGGLLIFSQDLVTGSKFELWFHVVAKVPVARLQSSLRPPIKTVFY
jgi:hypothetical protein